MVIIAIKSFFVGGNPPEAPKGASSPTAVAARLPMLGLIAANPVQVSVKKKNADESEGEVLFAGMLSAGESKNVPRPGAVYIEASAAENLHFEINGKRYNLGQLLGNGYQRGQLPAP